MQPSTSRRMKLRSKRWERKILPNELIYEVLVSLGIKDLLNCRSVNKVFKGTSTDICRRRHVRLDLDWDVHRTQNLKILYRNFSKHHLRDLPFSACKLFSRRNKDERRGRCYDSLTPSQITKFLGVFGPHITKCDLGGNNYPVIMRILEGMPNLRILICSVSDEMEDVYPPQISSNVTEGQKGQLPSLLHLKHLQIEIKWLGQVELLQLFLQHIIQSQLESIRVVIKANNGSADYSDRVAALIAPIPSISLDLNFIGPRQVEPFASFSLSPLRLRVLELTVPDPQGGRPDFFLPLHLLLARNSDSLETLAIEDREWDPEKDSPRLTIPPLRALQFLKFHCDEGVVHPPLVLLSPFTTNQFPSLRKVKLVFVNGFFSAFDSASFPSVTHLVVKDYNEENTHPMRTDWNRIFPNLTKLEVRGVSSGGLEYICSRMQGLAHLALRVNTSRTYNSTVGEWESKGNAHSILSGYPPRLLSEDDEVLPVRSSVTLLSLTALRTLSLDFRDCTEFPDSDIHLSLLQMQPLLYLCLKNTRMCEESKLELGRYHTRFEIIP